MRKKNTKSNRKKQFKVAALFAGCGGLDLGFRNAGFDIVWANEYDKTIWETYEYNHPHTELSKKSILDVKSDEIPSVDGVIGGPPCQSWSLAGAMRGINDPRGKLFYEYIRILKDKKPLFFLAENVAGILSSAHIDSFHNILKGFEDMGYKTAYAMLDAKHYGIPQDRKRVFIIGYSKDIGKVFKFPEPTHTNGNKAPEELFSEKMLPIKSLKEAIGDLPNAVPAKVKNKPNNFDEVPVPNHEYMIGGFSTIYMSRNRKREWDEPSFTIQAGGRHAPLHPSAPKMKKIEKDWWEFNKRGEKLYRRMSVRECARVQTFPDDFIFKYEGVADGYKMVGNAVPVNLATVLASQIKKDLMDYCKKIK